MRNTSQSDETTLRNSLLFYAAVCAIISSGAFLVALSVDIYLGLSLVFDYDGTVLDWGHLARVNLLAVVGMYYNLVFYEVAAKI